MAFGNFWRGRERFADDRNRDRWRTGGDWRDEGRDRNYWRENERQGMSGRDEYRAGSSGEYYGDPFRDYGSRGGDEDRDWRSQYGSGSGRDYERDYPSRSAYGAGSYESDWDYVGGYSGRGDYRSDRYGQGMQQQYRGKGPRGYRRSDERIREDVCDCLTDDPFLDASNIEVTVEQAEVVLAGRVNSRDDKRRAEDLAESISGVKDVRNNLRVTDERSREQRQTSGQSAAAEQTANQRSTTGQQGQTQQGQQTGRH